MSDKAAKIISAGLFALALSYFLTNMRELHVENGVLITYNKITGTVIKCWAGCEEWDMQEEETE
jgi:hypothetical protein